MNINPHILQFIIDKAKQRYEKYGESFRNDCLESTEIYDELDSLVSTELFPITAIFLLGSSRLSSKNEAICNAQRLGFSAVEIMAFENNLYQILSKGYNLWLEE